MQAAIDQGYATIAGELKVSIAPVGQVWQLVASHAPGIELWQPDGRHPTPAGTFLAACTLYTRIFGACPVGGSYTGGLTATDAATIEAVANQN